MKLTAQKFELIGMISPEDHQKSDWNFDTSDGKTYLITKKLDFMLWNRLVVKEQLNLLVEIGNVVQIQRGCHLLVFLIII